MNSANNETEILTNIFSNITNNIYELKQFQASFLINLDKIKNSINKLNNNYFDTEHVKPHIKPYLEMSEICQEVIYDLEQVVDFVEKNINNTCQHEWTNDLIDITPDTSKHICYCSKCEVTKNK